MDGEEAMASIYDLDERAAALELPSSASNESAASDCGKQNGDATPNDSSAEQSSANEDIDWKELPSTYEEILERCPLDPASCYYPLYLVQGLTIRKMGRFIHHEEALSQGLLRKVIRVEDGKYSNRIMVLAPEKKGGKEELVFDTQMYFISHRWSCPNMVPEEAHPDDAENSKLRALCRIVEKRNFMWFDYLCIPQRNPELQVLAIQSLPFYAHCSARFSALHNGEEGKDIYLSRLWCQTEIIASKIPIRLPNFNIQWIGAPFRGTLYDIRPFDRKGFHTPDANRKSLLDIGMIRDPSTCQLTDPNDMIKLLPLLEFAIKEFEDFLEWDASSSAQRRKTRTFGSGIYRMDEDPGRKKIEGGGIGTRDIIDLKCKLESGVDCIERSLCALKS